MIERTAPNGTTIQFPEGTSEANINAYLSLEKLKEKHTLEIQQLHERLKAEFSSKTQLSRQLMELKDKVKKLTFMKRYEEAELL